MIEEIEESKVKNLLSSFSCADLNADVDDFIHNKAIEFAKQGWAATHLVMASFQGKPVLAGYYSLTPKTVEVSCRKLSSAVRKRLVKFGQYDADTKSISVSMPLIAQLGKNYAHGYQRLITGDELLKMACDRVRDIQLAFVGRFVYLECEPKERLIDFYEANGFVRFGERRLDGDESNIPGDSLIQMLKYIKPEKPMPRI